jgi:hypothetical protein
MSDKGGLYLIAEDEDNGDLYKIPVKVSGEDINFGEPAPVVVEYVEKTAAARAAVVAGMRIADNEIRVHASRADTGGPDPSSRKGASAMDEKRRKALAAALGLPEDAKPEQILAATEEQMRQGVEGGEPETAGLRGDEVTPEQQPGAHQGLPGVAPTGTGTSQTQEQVEEENNRATENQPEAEAGFVRVDKDTWEATQRGAALAAKHEAERISDRQRNKVDAAVKAGKIPPARRDHYSKLMAMDEEGTSQLLDSLAASAVPLDQVGALGSADDDPVSAGQGLPDSWFPEIAERRAAIAAGARPVVTQAKEG